MAALPPTQHHQEAALTASNDCTLMAMAAVSGAAGSDLGVAGAFQGRHNAEVHPIDCHSTV